MKQRAGMKDTAKNPRQGSFAVDQLTDIVEGAVHKEFESISERGGGPDQPCAV